MEKSPQNIKKAAKKEPPDEDLEIDEEMKDLCREFLKFCEFVGILLALYLGLKLFVYVIVSLGTLIFGCGTVVTKTTIVEVDKYANKSGVWLDSEFWKNIQEVNTFNMNLWRETCMEKRDGFRYIPIYSNSNDLFARLNVFFINLHITLFSDLIVTLRPLRPMAMFRRMI